MDPNTTVALLNDCLYAPPWPVPQTELWEALRGWKERNGFVPSVKLRPEARRRMVRAGFGDVARWLDT